MTVVAKAEVAAMTGAGILAGEEREADKLSRKVLGEGRKMGSCSTREGVPNFEGEEVWGGDGEKVESGAGAKVSSLSKSRGPTMLDSASEGDNLPAPVEEVLPLFLALCTSPPSNFKHSLDTSLQFPPFELSALISV